MPYPKKRSDEEILSVYQETGGVWSAAKRLGMCGQSVHERLVKMGANKPVRAFSDVEREQLKEEYQLFADDGRLDELAEKMGRTKPFLCRQARKLGLTDQKHKRPYTAKWKYMSEEEAAILFEQFKKQSGTLTDFCRRTGYDDLGFSRTMQKHFPDEWDLVVEARHPRQTMYRLGRGFEYRVRDDLKGLGFFVLRSPRSGSPIDLVAIRKGEVLFIQCKRSGGLPPKGWNEIYDLAASVEATPILASRRGAGRKGIEYMKLIGRKDGSKRPQPMEAFEPKGVRLDFEEDATMKKGG